MKKEQKEEARAFMRLLKKLSPVQQAGFAMMVNGAAVIEASKKKTAN